MSKRTMLVYDTTRLRSIASLIRPGPDLYIELIRARIDAEIVAKHESIVARRAAVEEEVHDRREALRKALPEDDREAELAASNDEPPPERIAPGIAGELRQKEDRLADLDGALRTSAGVVFALGEPVLGEAITALEELTRSRTGGALDSVVQAIDDVGGIGEAEYDTGYLRDAEEKRRGQPYLGAHGPVDSELQNILHSLREAKEGLERKLAGEPWENTTVEPATPGTLNHAENAARAAQSGQQWTAIGELAIPGVDS